MAHTIETIAKGFVHGVAANATALLHAWRQYADTLKPWAHSVATRMVAEIARRDEKVWASIAKDIGAHVGFMQAIRKTPLEPTLRELVIGQANLITSLPLEAAKKVEEWILAAQEKGERPEALVDKIMTIGNVTRARATLIARTETARAATMLTEVRAKSIKSEGYIWTSAHDRNVRPLHRKLDGTFHRWDDPPISDERTGIRSLPGAIWGCRCIAKVQIPEAMWTTQ